jgi:hypothetical protein
MSVKRNAEDPTCPSRLSTSIRELLPYLVLLTVLIFVMAVRLRLASVPLERDEGEFAYIGQLLLQGVPPYLTSYSMKPPGIFVAYSLIMAVFGETASGIHVGLAVVNTLSVIIMFFLARRLRDSFTAVAASLAFALISLSESLLGCFAHATHFVVLFALAGFLLLIKALDDYRPLLLIVSGVLFGIAYSMKQQATFLIIFAVGYLLFNQLRSQRPVRIRLFCVGAFLFGITIPLTVMVILLFRAQALESYWYWTFLYPRELVASMRMETGLKNLLDQYYKMNKSLRPFLFAALVGIVALLRDPVLRNKRIFIGGFAFFSFIAVCPGFHFSRHYFVLMAPSLALLVGVGSRFVTTLPLLNVRPWLGLAVGNMFLLTAVSVFIVKERGYLFTLTPTKVSRASYDLDPFQESVHIARYLRERTTVTDRIAVIGSEPQIYFYAGRPAATGFNHMYGLMEQQPFALGMHQQMIREITAANPKFIVYVSVLTSWVKNENSPDLIFSWLGGFLYDRYKQVGVIDIISMEQTQYIYDNDARYYTPRSPAYLLIFERIDV